MREDIPQDWQAVLAEEFAKPYFSELEAFVEEERNRATVFPPREETFHALACTPYSQVRVFLVGQDPYHRAGQAHGLCFSVKPGIPLPPSLKNIYKELQSDLDIEPATHGFLDHWAQQGILMLNTVLTVRESEANSHQKRGWETFTDAIIDAVNAKPEPVIFVLWGNPAQKKAARIDSDRHHIIASAHPSPLSARRGFIGSAPFSRINATLESYGTDPIDWRLPELTTSTQTPQRSLF